jgi:hypothetical protein
MSQYGHLWMPGSLTRRTCARPPQWGVGASPLDFHIHGGDSTQEEDGACLLERLMMRHKVMRKREAAASMCAGPTIQDGGRQGMVVSKVL